MAQKRRTRRAFGAIRKLPSGRYQASYLAPDTGHRVNAPHTFETKLDADTWISIARADITRGEWQPTRKREPIEFAAFARQWIRRASVSERTRYVYETTLSRDLEDEFGGRDIRSIDEQDVNHWYDDMDPGKPAKRAQAYRVLRTIMNQAVGGELIVKNPCRIKGAAQTSSKRTAERVTADDMATLSEHMPPEYALAIPLAAFGALRAGEVLGLQRGDVNLETRTLDIRRSAGTSTPGAAPVGPLKTKAARRTVVMPSFVMDALTAHLNACVGDGGEAFLFPSPAGDDRPITYVAFRQHFVTACEAAKRPGLHFHDLRHSGALMAAHSGATVKELMHRLGHTSARMAMHYQAATQDRDRAIADAMDETYGGGFRD